MYFVIGYMRGKPEKERKGGGGERERERDKCLSVVVIRPNNVQ